MAETTLAKPSQDWSPSDSHMDRPSLPPSKPNPIDLTSPKVPGIPTTSTSTASTPGPEVPGAFRELASEGYYPADTPLELLPDVRGAVEYMKQNMPAQEDVISAIGSAGQRAGEVIGRVKDSEFVGRVMSYLPGSNNTGYNNTSIDPTIETLDTNLSSSIAAGETNTNNSRDISGGQFILTEKSGTGIVGNTFDAAKGFVDKLGMKSVAESFVSESNTTKADVDAPIGTSLAGSDVDGDVKDKSGITELTTHLSSLSTQPLLSQTQHEKEPINANLSAEKYPDPDTVPGAFISRANISPSEAKKTDLNASESTQAGISESALASSQKQKEREKGAKGDYVNATEIVDGSGIEPLNEDGDAKGELNRDEDNSRISKSNPNLNKSLPEPGLEAGASGVAPRAPIGLQPQDSESSHRGEESVATKKNHPHSGVNTTPAQGYARDGNVGVNNAGAAVAAKIRNPDVDTDVDADVDADSDKEKVKGLNNDNSNSNSNSNSKSKSKSTSKSTSLSGTAPGSGGEAKPGFMAKMRGEAKIISGKLRRDEERVVMGRKIKEGNVSMGDV